jgi:hypothetical protein
MLLRQGGKGLPLLSPTKGNNEWGPLHEGAGGEAVPLDGEAGGNKVLQDGAPCHTSRKVMALLKEKKISVMDWPGNSPDLNPIENLWAIMKARFKRVPNIMSLPLLERAIKMMLVKDLPISLMKKLAHSMPKRIQMCLQNQGQMTKY